jgi:chromosome segregation ATPase
MNEVTKAPPAVSVVAVPRSALRVWMPLLWAGCAGLQLFGTGWLLLHAKDLDTARKDTAEAFTAREAARRQRDTLQAEVATLTVQRDALATSQAVLEQAMAKAKTAQEQEALANANIRGLTSSTTSLSAEISNQEQKRTSLSQALVTTQATLDQLTTRIDTLRPEAQRLEQVAKDLKASQEQVTTAAATAATARQTAATLTEQSKALTEQIETDAKRRVELQRQIAAQRTEIESLLTQRKELPELAAKIDKAQQELAAANTARDAAKIDQDKIEQVARAKRAAFAELEAQSEARAREVERLDGQRARLTLEIAAIGKDRDQMVVAAGTASQELAGLDAKRVTLTALEARRVAAQAEVDALAQRKAELSGIIETLKAEREAQSKAIGNLRAQKALQQETVKP